LDEKETKLSSLSKPSTICALGIVLVIGVVAGIGILSRSGSATGDTRTFGEAGVESTTRRMASSCGVGGAPAMKADRLNGPMGNLVAGPIVIGCGRRNRELIQLVAFHTTRQLCAEMERPSKRQIVGGACKPVDLAWQDYCAELCIASVLPADIGRHHRYRHATLFGEASSKLTNIKAMLHGSKGDRAVPTIEGRVESTDLLEDLRESEPFVIFGTVIRPCTPPQGVEVVARGASGVVKRRGVISLPHICTAAFPPASSKK
jgi:hypothetical protein